MIKIVIELDGRTWDVVEEGTFQGKDFYEVINPETGEQKTFLAGEVTEALRDGNAKAQA